MQETSPLEENQLCVAIENFGGQEDGDLPFKDGEIIRIIKPCNLMFWYEARNENGKVGVVPSNFLKPIDEVESCYQQQPSIKSKKMSVQEDSGYVYHHSHEDNTEDPEVQLAQAKELRRRLPAGTLVVATCPFKGQEETDLGFEVYEEMMILNPLPDLCWYHAQKIEQPSMKGSIPITHVRLVYMSDDEEESVYKDVPSSSHDRFYDDANEFISQSGWFSFPGLPHCKEALHHVLAKKCKISYQDFIEYKEAVYYFNYTNGEKKFVGKAHVLHKEISNHFDHYEKKRGEIREIDDELCHHTNMAGWELMVWPLQAGMDLDVECGKKLIELDALVSKEGNGITEQMNFTSKASFDKFWHWFSPT